MTGMTDNFLQKFEEKVMTLLTELESARKEVYLLRQENSNLKADKLNYTKKLQALVSLFDSINAETSQLGAFTVMQGQEEFISI